jgi:carbon storage regulator
MLVLSRKIGEKIHVGNNITVEVKRISGNRVAVAIDAPKSHRILRGELLEAARQIEIEEAILQEIKHGSSGSVAGS